MIRPEFDDTLTQRFNVLRILWLSMMGSVLLFVGVAFLNQGEGSGAPDMMVYLLYGLAGSNALAALAFHRYRTSSEVLKNARSRGTSTGQIPPETPEEEVLDGAFQGYMTASIVAWALAESIALFGLVLTFLGAGMFHVVGLSAVALFLIAVLFRPSKGPIDEVRLRISGSS